MPKTIQTAAHVALLAPVPLEHLIDGKKKSDIEGRVAFGSRVWELFAKLDNLRKGMPVDVYIYASHGSGNRDFEVSWHARYDGKHNQSGSTGSRSSRSPCSKRNGFSRNGRKRKARFRNSLTARSAT